MQPAPSALAAARARVDGGLGSGFWRLLAASAISNLGDGIFWVALPLLAVSLTDSPALVAGVTVAQRLPWLVFALVAGALADRLDRRRTMVVVDLARVVLIGGLAAAVAAGGGSIVLVYVVAFALGIFETLFDTAAQSILPNVVERDRLNAANGRLYGVELTMNQFVGPPIGGLLAAFGVAVAFGVTAAGYLGAALAIGGLAGSFRPVREGPPTRFDREIREGIAFLAGHRMLRTLAIVVGMLNFAGGAVYGVLVLYAVAPGPMALSGVGFGLLLTASAIGSVTGTVLAGSIDRWLGKPNLVVACIVTLAAEHAVIASTTNPFLIGLALGLGGVVLGSFNVVFVSFRQRIVPNRLLGRVVATFRLVGLGSLPLGALVGGAVGEAFGLPAVFWAASVLTIVLLPARLVVTDRGIADAEAIAEATAAAERQAESAVPAEAEATAPAPGAGAEA